MRTECAYGDRLLAETQETTGSLSWMAGHKQAM